MREAVLRRSRGRCERCGKRSERLDPHHRKQRSVGGDNRLSNVVAVCRLCHDRIHFRNNQDDGWLLASWQVPDRIPITMYDGAYLLHDDGRMVALA